MDGFDEGGEDDGESLRVDFDQLAVERAGTGTAPASSHAAAGSSAAADPQVPGAGRMRPTGPSVARLIQTCLCIATRPFLAAAVGIAVSISGCKQQCG